jgi:peptidoglycan/LPS O-acetylase OafA/YrhL
MFRKAIRLLRELCKDADQQKTEYHMDSSDGLRGAMTFIVVFFHLQIVYSKLDVESTVSAYMNAFPIGGFFMQSSFVLTFKMLKEL